MRACFPSRILLHSLSQCLSNSLIAILICSRVIFAILSPCLPLRTPIFAPIEMPVLAWGLLLCGLSSLPWVAAWMWKSWSPPPLHRSSHKVRQRLCAAVARNSFILSHLWQPAIQRTLLHRLHHQHHPRQRPRHFHLPASTASTLAPASRSAFQSVSFLPRRRLLHQRPSMLPTNATRLCL